MIALLGTSNSNQALIAIILRLIDLDDTPRKLANLINLGTALADDCADHIIRDKDLLGEGLARQHVCHRVCGRSLLRGRASTCLARLVGACTRVCIGSLRVRVVNGGLGDGCRGWAVEIGDAIGVSRCALGTVVVAFISVRIPIGSVHRLWLVGDNLHPPRDWASGAAGAGCVSRCSRAAKTLGQLLDKSIANVVSRDMNCVRNAEHNQ